MWIDGQKILYHNIVSNITTMELVDRWIDGQKILYHNIVSNITTMELVDRWTEDIIP